MKDFFTGEAIIAAVASSPSAKRFKIPSQWNCSEIIHFNRIVQFLSSSKMVDQLFLQEEIVIQTGVSILMLSVGVAFGGEAHSVIGDAHLLPLLLGLYCIPSHLHPPTKVDFDLTVWGVQPSIPLYGPYLVIVYLWWSSTDFMYLFPDGVFWILDLCTILGG